jgi:hypothetical protein
MPRYGPVWLEIAEQQYRDLPADLRELIDQRLGQLLENPTADPTRSTTNAPISGAFRSALKACCSTPSSGTRRR